jgi:hypothetical protein
VTGPRQEHVQLVPALDDSAQRMTGAGGDFRIRQGPQQMLLFGRPPVERRLIGQDSQLLAPAPNRLFGTVERSGHFAVGHGAQQLPLFRTPRSAGLLGRAGDFRWGCYLIWFHLPAYP